MSDAGRSRSGHPGPAAIWSKGDFAMVADLRRTVAERTRPRRLTSCPTSASSTSPAASGNGAIAAARRTWGNTVGVDFVPALLERGRERAAAERLEVEFVEADARTALRGRELRRRHVDLRGDVRARPAEGGLELLRVASPAAGSGWPTGSRRRRQQHVRDARQARPAAAGVEPPRLWGTEERVRELFGDGIADLRIERRISRQPFRSVDHYLRVLPHLLRPDPDGLRAGRPEGETRSPTTCARSWRRSTPATARSCSSPSTCR